MMPKYDRILILSLLPISVEILKKKCLQKGIPTDLILVEFDFYGKMIPLNAEEKEKISKLTGNSHLFIDAHGSETSPFVVFNDDGKMLLVGQIAKLISENTADLKILSGLHISLEICYGGKEFKTSQFPLTVNSLHYKDKMVSLSSLLQDWLEYYGVNNTEITSYNQIVGRVHTGLNQIYRFAATPEEMQAIYNINFQIKIMRSDLMITNPAILPFFDRAVNNGLENLMKTIKIQERQRKQEKLLFSAAGSEHICVDSRSARKWENEAELELKKAGLVDQANELHEKRTYLSKFHFLSTLGQDPSSKSARIAKTLLDEAVQFKVN